MFSLWRSKQTFQGVFQVGTRAPKYDLVKWLVNQQPVDTHFVYLFLYGESASTFVVAFKLSLTKRYPSFCISSPQNCWIAKASDSETDDRHFSAVDFESRLVENGVEPEFSPLRSLKYSYTGDNLDLMLLFTNIERQNIFKAFLWFPEYFRLSSRWLLSYNPDQQSPEFLSHIRKV